MLNLNLKSKNVLLRPRVTEKGALGADKGVYVFEVSESADKKSIKASVKAAYGVTPRRVAVARIPSRQVFIRGKKGLKSGGKKAYVYLKKGDKIKLI